MKTLKRSFAAFCAFVLAFAMMVPSVALAADEDMSVRINYAGRPIVIHELDGIPHSLILQFHAHESYTGYAGAMSMSFTMSDSLKGLRVSKCVKNSDGSYTIALSEGNGVLPMTDGNYLDLGTMDIHIDGTVNYNSPDVRDMTSAVIAVTDFQVSDGDYNVQTLTGAIGSPSIEVPFTLASNSFANVVGNPPVGGEGGNGGNGGSGGNGGGTGNDGNGGNGGNGGNDGGALDAGGNFTPPFKTAPTDVSKLPASVTPPTETALNNTLGPIAKTMLETIWNGKEPTGISDEDAAKLAAFLEQVRNAGLTVSDVQVKYALSAIKYDDDVPANDLKRLSVKMSDYDSLGFYDIGASMEVSVPSRTDIAAVKAAFQTIDPSRPLTFTVDVPAGKLSDDKQIVAAYVHDNKANLIDSGVVANAEANKVTFPAWEFSTYGVYSEGQDVAPTPNNPNVGSLVNSNDNTVPFVMLGLGAVVIIAVLAVVFTKRRRAQQ